MQVVIYVKISDPRKGTVIHDGNVKVDIAETASPYDVVQTVLEAARASGEEFSTERESVARTGS